MEHIIVHFGVFAIFLGAALEGEPFALAGGILAHRHWISPIEAVAAAIGGSWLVDQMWFHLSRHYRQSRVVQHFTSRPAFQRSLELIESHPIRFVLLFRFAYGLRAVAPVAIGASRVPRRLFVPLNLAAAIVWGIVFTTLGELAGPLVEAQEARYGSFIALSMICISVLALTLALRRGK